MSDDESIHKSIGLNLMELDGGGRLNIVDTHITESIYSVKRNQVSLW